MINPEDFKAALIVVLELAEENALQDEDVEDDPSIQYEQLKQKQACELIREFIEQT